MRIALARVRAVVATPRARERVADGRSTGREPKGEDTRATKKIKNDINRHYTINLHKLP